MRFQSRFVAEQLIEQKLRRVVLVAANQEQLRAGILLRFRQEVVEDGRDLVGLPLLGARCSGTAPPRRHCMRSTPSTTDLNRLPTGCCGTPARGRATLSFRSSH